MFSNVPVNISLTIVFVNKWVLTNVHDNENQTI